MKKLLISFLAITFLVTSVGCASIQEEVANVEQTCKDAKETHKQVKDRLDRDFKLLFGTKDGQIDTKARKVSETEDPGLQDIVFSRFDEFDTDTRQKLEEANKEAVDVYYKYKELNQKIEKRGSQACDAIKKLSDITKRREVSKEGLTLLKEFITIAGKSYLKSQN